MVMKRQRSAWRVLFVLVFFLSKSVLLPSGSVDQLWPQTYHLMLNYTCTEVAAT